MKSDLDNLNRTFEKIIEDMEKTAETSRVMIQVTGLQTKSGDNSYIVVYLNNNSIGKLKVKEYQEYISDSHKYEFEVFGGDDASLGKFSVDMERPLLLYNAEDIAKVDSIFKVVFRESTKEYKVVLTVSMQLSYKSKKSIIIKKKEKLSKIQNEQDGIIRYLMKKALCCCFGAKSRPQAG